MALFFPGSDPVFHSGTSLPCIYILQALCMKSKDITFISYYSVFFNVLHFQIITADSFFLTFANAVFSHWYSSKQFSSPPCFALQLLFSAVCEQQHSWLHFQLPLAQLLPFNDCWDVCSQFTNSNYLIFLCKCFGKKITLKEKIKSSHWT